MADLLNVYARLDSSEKNKESYTKLRDTFLGREQKRMIGGNITLTEDEEKVNRHLMKLKQEEMDAARSKFGVFYPDMNFLKAKDYIDKSKVFQLLRRMPKGAALHLHSSAIVDVHWLIKNATYREHCYMGDKDGVLRFQYNQNPPPESNDHNWELVNARRKNSGNPQTFDEWLFSNLTLGEEELDSQDALWTKFQNCFTGLGGLLSYAPVFKDYLHAALEEFYSDNVQYLEIRITSLSKCKVYEMDGTTYDHDWLVETFRSIVKQFRETHADFIGAKLIYCSTRNCDATVVMEHIKDAVDLYQKYPDVVVGYDLVGQEDHGHTLLDYIDELMYPRKLNPPVNLPYFFHAGETDWQGTSIDDNLLDAVLFNASRIGHGFAINKHPEIMKLAREKDIAIEVNPISNQVLGLVGDMRDHPAVLLFAQNFPLVISSDDPALWRASGLSYDFYQAIMALGGSQADLATAKALGQNSIRYSAMGDDDKVSAMKMFHQSWDKFIQEELNRISAV